MLGNLVKITVRNLLRHKLSTFINISGLSIGVACCILIILYVMNEFSFDTFHENADRIYRVLTTQKRADGRIDKSAFQPMPVTPALKEEFPEILHAARLSTADAIVSYGDRAFEEAILFTDPDIFRIFDISLLKGNPETALNNPNEILLTQPMAEKYFGTEPPLGKVLRLRTHSSEEDLIVAGITEPMPVHSSIRFDFLVNLQKYSSYEQRKNRWTSANGSAFILLPKNQGKTEFEEKLPAFVQKYYGETIQRWQSAGNLSKDADAWKLTLQPLADVHLDRTVGISPEKRGDATYSYVLAGIAALVLAIACINFVTLTVSRSANRAKEVGVRKVLGADRTQLVRQFWGEAFLLCAISLVTGLVLAELFLPSFSLLAATSLSIDLADGMLLVGLAGLLIILGIAAGSYPAFYLTRFQPAETLRGKFKLGGKSPFMRMLIVFQFGLSTFLVCGALILNDQLHFLITKNLGFRPEQVVVLPTYAQQPDDALRITNRLRAFVGSTSDILDVSVTSGAFTHGYDVNGFQVNGENKISFVYRIDEHYLTTLGIPLKEGRGFRENSADDRDYGMIVNESFLQMMGWPEPAVGRTIIGSDSKMVERRTVVGVVPDFHFTSLQQEIQPVMMFMNPLWPLNDVLIRISGDNIPATMQRIRSFWKEVAPGMPFNATFLDEDFRKEYESEMRWGRIVSSSSVFAVALACLGLFGLVTLTLSNRTKEIGIRKVLGASSPGIIRLVSGEFLKLVLLGNLLAWPAAYLAGSRYLENYAYRIDLDPVVFLLAGGLAAGISFVVILGQVLKASRTNPVESLRYE